MLADPPKLIELKRKWSSIVGTSGVHLTFRENVVYTLNKVANYGVYTIDISPMPKYKKYNHMSTTTLYICRE